MDVFDEPVISRDSTELREAIKRVHDLAVELEKAALHEPAETLCAIGDQLQAAAAMVVFHAGFTDDQSGQL